MDLFKKLVCALLILGLVLEPSLLYSQYGSFQFEPGKKDQAKLDKSYKEFVSEFLKINSKENLDVKELQDFLLELSIYIKQSVMATDEELEAGERNSPSIIPGYTKYAELKVLEKKIAEYLWIYSLAGEIQNAEARFLVYSNLLALKKELKSYFKSRKPTGSAIDDIKVMKSVVPESYEGAIILSDFGEAPVNYKALHKELYYSALDNLARIYYSNIYIYGKGDTYRGLEAAEGLCESAGDECLTAVKKAVNAQSYSFKMKGVKRQSVNTIRTVIDKDIIPAVNDARNELIKKVVIDVKELSVNTMQEYDTRRFGFYLNKNSSKTTGAIETYWKAIDEIIKKYPESRFMLGDEDLREDLLMDPEHLFQSSITGKKDKVTLSVAQLMAKKMNYLPLRKLNLSDAENAFNNSQSEIEEYAEKIIDDYTDTQEESKLPIIMQNTSKFLERIAYLTRSSPFSTSAVFVKGGEGYLGAVDEIDRAISLQKQDEKDTEQIKRVLGVAGLVIGAVLLCTGILTLVGKGLVVFSTASLAVIEGVTIVAAVAFGVVTGYETYIAIDEFNQAQMGLAEQISLTFGDEGYVNLDILKELDSKSSQALTDAIIDGAFTLTSLLVLPELVSFAKTIGSDLNKLVRSYTKLCGKYKTRIDSEVLERALVYASVEEMSQKEVKSFLAYLEKNPKSKIYQSLEEPLGNNALSQIKEFKDYDLTTNSIYKYKEDPLLKELKDINMAEVSSGIEKQLVDMNIVIEKHKYKVTSLEYELKSSLNTKAPEFLKNNSSNMKMLKIVGGEGLGTGTAGPYEKALLHPDFKKYQEYIVSRGGVVMIDPTIDVSKTMAYFRPSDNLIAIRPTTKWHHFEHEFSHFRLNDAFTKVKKLADNISDEFYYIGMRFTKEDLLFESSKFKDLGLYEYAEGLEKIKAEYPELVEFLELMNETGLKTNINSLNEIVAVRRQVKVLEDAGFEFTFQTVDAKKYAESWLQYDLYYEWMNLSPKNADFITPRLEDVFKRSQLVSTNLDEIQKELLLEFEAFGDLSRLVQPPLVMRSIDGKTLIVVVGSGMVVTKAKE